MKKTTKQQELEKQHAKRPGSRPLVPRNQSLQPPSASHQQKPDRGSRAAGPASKQTTSIANKENLPKPSETPRFAGKKSTAARASEAKSTAAPLTRAASKLKAQPAPKATPSQQASTQIRRPALAAGDSLFNSFDDLTVKFETLKRQSLRPSISGSAIRPPPHKMRASPIKLAISPKVSAHVLKLDAKRPPSRLAACSEKPQSSKGITALAEELFDEPEFLDLCGKAMNTNLQRTRDGATAESRVQELAGRCTICNPSADQPGSSHAATLLFCCICCSALKATSDEACHE